MFWNTYSLQYHGYSNPPARMITGLRLPQRWPVLQTTVSLKRSWPVLERRQSGVHISRALCVCCPWPWHCSLDWWFSLRHLPLWCCHSCCGLSVCIHVAQPVRASSSRWLLSCWSSCWPAGPCFSVRPAPPCLAWLFTEHCSLYSHCCSCSPTGCSMVYASSTHR